MSDKLWMYISQWADLDGEDTGIHTEKIPVRKKGNILYIFCSHLCYILPCLEHSKSMCYILLRFVSRKYIQAAV